MVVGLIHDIPTVKELIDPFMADAHAIISKRLASIAWTDRRCAPQRRGEGA